MTLSIEEISDWISVNDIYTRYVHGVDDRDFNSLDQVFLPETTFDWSSSGGPKTTWEEAKRQDFITGKIFAWIFHVCVNVRIDFAPDHRTAVVKSKTIHPSGIDDANGKPCFFQVHGAYTDEIIKINESWRIKSRVWQHSWVVGPFEKVDGIPGMLEIAGKLS